MKWTPRRLAFWVLTLVLAGSILRPDQSAADGAGGAADLEGFRKNIAPFLQQHCVTCHGSQKQKGGLALHTIDGNVAGGKDLERWKAVAERLALNEMPPESEPRPDFRTLTSVRAWLKDELAKRGESIADAEHKLLLPGHGNRVDHAALFSGAVKGPAASPARLWRLSPQIYSSFLPRISGLRLDQTGRANARVAQPFSTSSAEGFKDYANLFVIDEPTIVQLMRNAQQAVEARNVGKFLVDLPHKPTDAEMRTAISRQFQLVLLRDPSEPELQRFVQLMTKNMSEAGQAVGVRNTLATVLMLPEALYRVELGQGPPDQFGRRLLSPRELAYAIAFALTDNGPDAVLLGAAEQGRLTTHADVRREVERLLNDRSIAKPRIMRFFEEYFEFPTLTDVFKDFPDVANKKAWQAEVLVDDTRYLIRHVLDQDRDVLKELLTTNKSFVNYKAGPNGAAAPAWINPKKNQLEIGHWYGLSGSWKWTATQPLELPADQRAGILTQPSWLAAFATNDQNHAIRRGKWVRERLLGGVVPDVPITVDAKLPDAPDKTLRERMEITREEYCWKCHGKMNPLGLAFEGFDYLGRFRARELNRPVDTTGSIEQSGDPKLDGPVASAVEMVRQLADAPRVRQVFVRHAFRFWMGRNELLSDSPTLIAADRAYVESGGSMKALISALLTSDSFLYRMEPEKSQEPTDKSQARSNGQGPKP